jgi:phage gp36-like protein
VAYLNLAAFKLLTIMPTDTVDVIEAVWPGFLDAQFVLYSSKIDARLRKRYKVPFAAAPDTVKGWLTSIVTWRAYWKRGGTDEMFAQATREYEEALAEIKEAADGDVGLFDLPLDDSADASAISKQATRGYSEQSPYVGFDQQAATGRSEDASGGGTFT